MYKIAGEMCLSSKRLRELRCGFVQGEWVTLGLVALKASNRNPESGGEVEGKYCSKTRSLKINLSFSGGT